jgi:type VI secretion system protein ImpC
MLAAKESSPNRRVTSIRRPKKEAGAVKFDIDLGNPPGDASRRRSERPLKVLVMGHFAGTPYALHRVDLDTFDAVMTAAKPQIEIQAAGLGESRLRLEFPTLDDFHPDAIFRSCGVFAALREQRARLADPATFRQAAAALLDVARDSTPPAKPEDEMFERLLGSSGRDAPARAATQGGAIQKLISSVVAPHIVPDLAPEQNRYIASVDAAIAALMREILHAPAFQALESAWRGARALLDETEGGEEVQVWLLDASAQALQEEVARCAEDPARSTLFDVLVGRAERAPDAEPWSLVIGDYLFGPAEGDLSLLATLGALCRRAGAIFVGGASPRLAGCESFATSPHAGSWTPDATDAWSEFRSQPFASSVALAAPRTLFRLPYGKTTDAIDSFAFEELAGENNHESLLWGNSAFVLGRLLVRGFVANGWDMQPDGVLELADLPALVRGTGDDRRLQACAEVYLGERGGERLLSLGLVPLLSHEQRAAVRVMRVQSIAEPLQELAWRA